MPSRQATCPRHAFRWWLAGCSAYWLPFSRWPSWQVRPAHFQSVASLLAPLRTLRVVAGQGRTTVVKYAKAEGCEEALNE